MNYGIGNVKGKSSGGGGGGIPVITLQASQMIDQTHIQFTEEQYNTIVANGCFYLDLLGSQQLLMTCVNASNLADIQCYNISQTGSGLQLATIDLNKTTYIGVLGISPYPQAKQLYQHNIKISQSFQMTGNWDETIDIFLKITNDSSTEINTYNQIENFLKNNNFRWNTDYSWGYCYPYEANGSVYDAIADKEYSIRGIYALYSANSGAFQKVQFIIRRNTHPVTFMYIDSSALVRDKVIAL